MVVSSGGRRVFDKWWVMPGGTIELRDKSPEKGDESVCVVMYLMEAESILFLFFVLTELEYKKNFSPRTQ